MSDLHATTQVTRLPKEHAQSEVDRTGEEVGCNFIDLWHN